MARVILYVVMTLIAVTPLQVDSQSLTSNNTNGMVCPGQDVEYTCSTGNRLLSWTSPSVLFGISNPNTNIMNLEVTTVSNDSVTISVLIIRYSKTMNATNVTCLPTFTPISLLYYPIHEINSNVSFKVEFINLSSIRAMWTPEETIVTYTVYCPLGECEPSFLQQNERQIIFQVRNYSMLNVCLTANNICNNNFNVCTEVFPVFPTSCMPTPTAKSVLGNLTTFELPLSSTVKPEVSTVSASNISIIVATNISSFFIGLVLGISAASIVWLCTWRMKKRRGMLPSTYSVDYQPSQAYDDVDIVKVQDMQLQENVAYGQVKGL